MTKRLPPINKALARKVLAIVDKGLSEGLGEQTPGQMCIEAAVCYAMGLPHGDAPPCVNSAVRDFKISLNDCRWKSYRTRAKGMRRLAIAQLGSKGVIKSSEFNSAVDKLYIDKYFVPYLDLLIKQKTVMRTEYLALKNKAHQKNFKGLANQFKGDYRFCLSDPSLFYIPGAHAIPRDLDGLALEMGVNSNKLKAKFAEDVVQILIKLKSPGAKWLDLTE